MLTDPAFGLAVPFYRDLGLLSEVVASIVGQSDPNWRCVVLDDCSEEAAADAVARFGDDRVVYRRNEHRLGIAGNFNQCFAVLGDEFGVPVGSIVHADDVLLPDFVARMRAAHCEHPGAAAVAGRVEVIGPDGLPGPILADRVKHAMWRRRDEVQILEGERGLARLLTGLFWYCPAMSFRFDRLPVVRWDPRWQQVMDLDLFGRLLLADEHLILWPHDVYQYRRHAATSTSVNTQSLVRFHEEAAASEELAAAAGRRGWTRAVRAGRLRVVSRMNCLLTALSLLLRRRWHPAADAARLVISRGRSRA